MNRPDVAVARMAVVARTEAAGLMKEYRALVLTFEGNVIEQRVIVSADEADAIKQSKRLIGSQAVELWDGPPRVARFAAISR